MTISSLGIIISHSLFIYMSRDGKTDSMKASRHKISSIQLLDPVRAQNRTISEKQSFLSTNGDLLLLTALKKSEDDNTLTMRLVEMGGAEKNFDLKFFTPIQNLVKTNLIEDNCQNTGLKGDVLKMKIGKNSIETYKLDTEQKLMGHRFLTFNAIIQGKSDRGIKG